MTNPPATPLTNVPLPVMPTPSARGLPIPQPQTPGAAAVDLPCAVDISINPGQRAAVPTGFAVAVPQGYEGQVRSRSGLALKYGLAVLNSPGLIDPDYRGEIFVILINHGDKPVRLPRGSRIAQLLISPAPQPVVTLVSSLSPTQRANGRFGSTDP